MKKTLLALSVIASLCACNDSSKFHIEGNIENAKDSTLYLEHIGIENITVLDSAKLGEDGSFKFSQTCEEGPDFYRLRIAGQIINISIDSTETIKVQSQMPNMASDYKVEGSKNCETIKELALKQIALQDKIIKIQKDGKLDIGQKEDSIKSLVDNYKNFVKKNYILAEPQSAASYFALFQTVGNYLLFDPVSDREDVKYFAAVATSWDNYHPGTLRTRNLHNITIRGMQNTQKPVQRKIEIESSKIKEAGCIDIALKNKNGVVKHLQDLGGKVVILDFTVYNDKNSPARIMKLRDIYNKYHAQGLEIYQVSLDDNEHFWKTSVDALPWICVRNDESNFPNLYGVQSLPTFFVLDRSNTLKERLTNISQLEEKVSKYI